MSKNEITIKVFLFRKKSNQNLWIERRRTFDVKKIHAINILNLNLKKIVIRRKQYFFQKSK
jgi:hypothetical protein